MPSRRTSASGGPAFELYALGLEHKHVPELHALRRADPAPDLRTLAVAHMRQGMIDSIPLHLRRRCPANPDGGRTSHETLQAYYRHAPHIRVRPAETAGRLEPEALNDTDDMELRVFAHAGNQQAILVARLDNLGKGASGAAVQNLRLMLGLPAAAEPALAG